MNEKIEDVIRDLQGIIHLIRYSRRLPYKQILEIVEGAKIKLNDLKIKEEIIN